MDDSIRSGAEVMAGTTEDAIRKRCREFWTEEVQFEIRDTARKTIEAHRKEGNILVLLTSSSNYLAELLAQELGFEHVLCNTFLAKDGVLTGVVNEPLCFGQGKVTHAKQLAQRLNIALEDCYFYTDSFSDLPVLQCVGYPIVVSPDARLKREAKSNGWVVEQWD